MTTLLYHPPTQAILVVTWALLTGYAIIRGLTRQHSVPATFAWLFAIVALPGVGAVFYLLLAHPSIERTRRRRQKVSKEFRGTLFSDCTPDEANLTTPPFTDTSQAYSIMHLCAAITGLFPSRRNHSMLLNHSKEAFAMIEASLLGATQTIWAEYYIINNDATGHRFLEILAERARAGVEVRLLFDAIGSLSINQERLRSIKAAGGRTEVFLPLNPLRRRWSVHLRNHRKLIVVDGEVGFTGGMNVGDEYSGRGRRGRGGARFRDSHLALRGPAVANLASIFAEDWLFATEERLKLPQPTPAAGDSIVAVVPSGPDQEQNANALVYFSAINSAERRCWITSPYFMPDVPTEQALIAAALRGVDVRIMVPAKPDVFMVGPVARAFYPRLLRAGVRIFEYRPAMLHGKTLVVDGCLSIVGSANVDMRSFRLNFELGALVFETALASQLEATFTEYTHDCHEVSTRSVERRPFVENLYLGVARLLAPLL